MPPRPLDDEPETQQLRRVQPPLPGSLDPTREGGDTSVLSLDDMMQAGAEPAPARTPVAPPPVVRPTSRPAEAPRGETQRRLRTDAAALWQGASRRSEAWLRMGDNALALATAMLAVLLLVIIAAL